MAVHEWLPFIVRPIIALLTQTFFQPDEYFQSLEPAHHVVFGYGHLTWEWKTQPPIRSVAFPAIFVPIYWFLKVTGLSETGLLISAPKLLSGLVAGLTDYFTFKLSKRVLGQRYASVALLVSLTSFFHTLSLSRTLSNSWETSLTIAGLYYWPLPGESVAPRLRISLVCAALSCIVRPTSVIIWAFMGGDLVLRAFRRPQLLRPILANVIPVGLAASVVLVVIDTLYHGSPTFTPLNFIRINTSSVALFYGSNPFHYYISQALPILCTTALPFVIHGAWKCWNTSEPSVHRLLGLCAWTIGVYSLAGHKEWRFIHPILPLLHIFAAKSLVDLSSGGTGNKRKGDRFPSIRRSHLLLLLSAVPASLYVMFFHGRAQIAIMHHLRSLPNSTLHSVGFLMPCHSTPMHAYLHRPHLEVWSIGCEPPLGIEDLRGYRDQTRIFYESPNRYLETRFPPEVDPHFPPSLFPSNKPGQTYSPTLWNHTWPSHIALFGALIDEEQVEGRNVKSLLTLRGYRETWRAVNGFEEDEKRRGGVRLWEWSH